MMNLMVDGVKKDGLQLPPEPAEEQEKEEIKNEVSRKNYHKANLYKGKKPYQEKP
jgi:hypothetical protein